MICATPQKTSQPNLPPGFGYKIADWEKNGFTFVEEQYWGDTYMAIFEQRWSYNPVSLGNSGEDCDQCGAAVGVILLRRQENGEWKPLNMTQGVAFTGKYGKLQPGDVVPIRFSKDKYGILVRVYSVEIFDFLYGVLPIEVQNYAFKAYPGFITHYDNYYAMPPEEAYSFDVSVEPEWNTKTKTTDLILTLTQRGTPTPEIDTEFIQPTLSDFNGKDKIRMIYFEDEFLIKSEE